ncbi:hypothetical protein [Alkalinema sp. FACHB-956]|uniref:hypothetical protein n=1 Tax=Alkalinema sp. FACHB-956 TaxID=2692768 RepID=UPI00168375C3|nr:hypothetical protein [Alkalinema sp. FACHB-956]MBD2329872.1 hypothetical protein [Alkalinema sp. FACHB-956]
MKIDSEIELGNDMGDEVEIMTVRQPRYSKEAFAQRGNAIYESQVRSQVEKGNHRRSVAID